MSLDWMHIALAALGWTAAAAGSAAATRVTLRWHWAEIQRAHARLERVESRVSALEVRHAD